MATTISIDILSEIRESVKFVNENGSDLVTIDKDAIDKFVENLDRERLKKLEGSSASSMPLNFQTEDQHINFLFLLNILNFGSGFRKQLHEKTGRGSFQSIVYGCINMFIDHGEDFSSKFFADMTLDEVVQFFSIPITEEKKIGDSGVLSQIVASELKSLCVNIQSVISQSGKKLQLLGFKDISSFVKYKLKEHNSNENAASFLISTLIETFPAFKDASPFRGKPQIFILKKVQLFVADLYRHFRKTNKLFEFGDINRLTVFADNVLPAVLRELKILKPNEEICKQVDSGTPIPSGDEKETALRANAVLACELILEKIPAPKLNAMDLDFFLWTIGKDEKFRSLERHSTIDTVYY